MSRITSQILIGGIKEAQNGRWLQYQGVTHIVNASMELPNYFPQNFKYLRLDLNDVSDQNLTKALSNSYRFMKKTIDEGGVVFVHCFAGISRSSSQIIHFLMMDRNISFEKALDYVRRKHPRTNPNGGFQQQLLLKDPTKKVFFNSQRSSYPVTHQDSWWNPW